VAFLWNWTASGKPALPAGHPAIFKADPQDEKPAVFNATHFPMGVNANFLDTDPHSCAAKFAGPNGLFECESRQIKKHAPDIIKTLRSYGLQEGNCVGDVGAGTGVLTRLLSRAVGPQGVVIAEELSPSFLTLLEEEKQQSPHMNNVLLVQGSSTDINFPHDKQCDLIVVCDVYHHFEYPLTTLR
jgi:ubiquinone/menaquinone biosynthesis C-methylase UbiE